MGQKIRLNEAQLKKIISESVKKTINELFDTPEGKDMACKIRKKANEVGRTKLANNIDKALHDDSKEKYDSFFTYDDESVSFKPVNSFFKGEVTSVYTNGNIWSTGKKVALGDEKAKTNDKRIAREIASWCQKYMSPEVRDYESYCDWHTWVSF